MRFVMRQLIAFLAVAVFAAGGALSAAASVVKEPPAHAVHVHDHGTAHGHGAQHSHHYDDAADVASTADHSQEDGGCDHPHHPCCHAHASCCVSALAPAADRQPQPTLAWVTFAGGFDVLPSGGMPNPLLRPPRAAA